MLLKVAFNAALIGLLNVLGNLLDIPLHCTCCWGPLKMYLHMGLTSTKTHFSLLTGLNRTENTENMYTVSFHPSSQVWGRWGVYYHTLLINVIRFLPSQINLNICNQIQLAEHSCALLRRFGQNLEKMISPTCSQKGRHESNVVTLQINLWIHSKATGDWMLCTIS